jgi:diguanylate cyclase (GGDEF)-like protein/PAS domain S-box-containing protein
VKHKKRSSKRRSPSAPKTGGLEFQSSVVRGVLDASPDGVLVVDQNGTVVCLNDRFLEVWGIPRDQVHGGRANTVVGTPDSPILAMAVARVKEQDAFLKRVQELYADPGLDDHCEIELNDGRTLERHSTVLRGDGDRYLGRIWFFRDISARKQTETVLRNLASFDPLTNVPNRRQFFDRANEEFARARRYQHTFSLVMIDVDHFKRINDRYGHAVGDQVLKALCELWKQMFRQTDTFGRIGGEEFAALLPDTNLIGARLSVERFRRYLSEHPVSMGGGIDINFTISAGVASFEPGDATVQDCVQRADRALYRAKEMGRNRTETESDPG